jgi:hypothetical protein
MAAIAAGWAGTNEARVSGTGGTDEIHHIPRQVAAIGVPKTGAHSGETLPGNRRMSRLVPNRKTDTYLWREMGLLAPIITSDSIFLFRQ